MKKKQIFIIEDEEITITQISYFLKLRGFEIAGQASYGEEAISRVLRSKPDAILVDIKLSGKLDGIETINFIYREYSCPVIYITSDDDPLTLERIMETRPYGFLKKPLRFDALCNTLELAIEKFETESKLKENENLFSLIVNSLKDYAISMIHPNGLLVSWNDGLEKMHGYKSKELQELNYLDLLSEPPDTKKKYFEEILKNALNQGKYATDLWVKRKNGELFLTDTTFTPVRDKDNVLKGFSIIARDITEKQKMEQEKMAFQERLKQYNEELEQKVQERTLELKDLNHKLQKEIHLNQIFEKQLLKSQKNLLEAQKLSGIGNWEISFESGDVFISPEIYKMLGIQLDSEPPQMDVMLEIVSPQKQENSKQYLLAQLESRNELNFDKSITLADKTIFVNVIIKPVLGSGNTIIGLFGTIHDITIRRKAIEETERALKKEKELNQMKNKFVSMLTHEFRTPLTVILSNAQLLERLNDSTSNEEKKERYMKIYSACNKMNELMDEILKLGKLKEMEIKVHSEDINLKEFSKSIVSELSSTEFGSNRIEVEINSNREIFCVDPNLLRYIIINLLMNALKFSPLDSKVYFQLLNIGDTLVIRVKDFGVGIPEPEQEKIFHHFYRASNVRKIKGTGLGLALAKEYVEAMNGNISVKSTSGVETIFEVIIPV
jgi:PAS domain S-box-containing protein